MNRDRLVRVVAVVALVGWMTGNAVAQPEAGSRAKPKSRSADMSPSRRYTFQKDHDPNGIGKFYQGREIARVMGYGFNGAGARWLERAEREREEKLMLMVRSLKLEPGQTVAGFIDGLGEVSTTLA